MAPPPMAAPPNPAKREAHAHPMSATRALLVATEQLSLTDAQRSTVKALEDRLDKSGMAIRDALAAMHQDVAAEVRAGAIGGARVQADEALLVSAIQNHALQELGILNELHAALTRPQRAALVAAVRAEAPRQVAPSEYVREDSTARLDYLTRELNLDPDQRQLVSSVLFSQPAPTASYRAESRRRFDVVLNAFSADTFDVRTAILSTEAPEPMVHLWVQHAIAVLSGVLPVLHPDQREKLASMIEAHRWWDHPTNYGKDDDGMR